MKKALTLVLLLILSYVVVVVGRINEWQAVWYAGLGFGAAVLLAMVIGAIKLAGKFVSESVSSAFFVLVALGIVGVLSWQSIIPAFLGYAVGTALGIALVLILFRKLAQWAQKSMLFGEVFQFASNYKIRSYLADDSLIDKRDAQVINIDFKNITLVLKQLGYPNQEAEEAANFAMTETQVNTPIEDKVKKALSYFEKDSVEIFKARSN